MTAKRTIFILLIVLLGVVPIAGSINAGREISPRQDTATQVPRRTRQASLTQQPESTVQPQAPTQAAVVSSNISALGSVEANSVASLQFQTMGIIDGVYAEVGNYVKSGEVLADLNTDNAWNTYNQAVLNRESAQIARDDLDVPVSAEDLAIAKANVTSAQAGYSSAANATTPTQIENAQMQYDQSLAQLAALKDERAHMGGTDAQITLQEAQIGTASFNAEIARLQLVALKTPNSASLWSASIRIKQAQLALEQIQAGPTQDEVKSAQIAIDLAQAKVLDAQTTLQQVQLIAPISGYVTAVNITAGQAVATDTIAIEISDLSVLHMTVPINELDIARIKEGTNATIQLDALTDLTVPGKIEHVGWLSTTSTDGIVTYAVQVVLNTTDTRVRLGMTGEVTIETGSTSS